MPTNTERQQNISALQELPAALEAIVQPLSDAELDAPGPDGGWSVRQVVHHLADSHLLGYARTRWALTENSPTIQLYHQEGWANLPDSRGLAVRPSLALLYALHARWIFLLDQIDETSWQRTTVHPERGTVTIDDLLAIYAGHGSAHLRQITENLTAQQTRDL